MVLVFNTQEPLKSSMISSVSLARALSFMGLLLAYAKCRVRSRAIAKNRDNKLSKLTGSKPS